MPAAVSLELPREAALAVFEKDSSEKLYFCDGYEIAVQTLTGGDLEKTLRTVTGFTKDRLTLMETEQGALRRYDCVWSAAGETEQRVGRTAILDDGAYHYAVTVMADESKAAPLSECWNALFRSLTLETSE